MAEATGRRDLIDLAEEGAVIDKRLFFVPATGVLSVTRLVTGNIRYKNAISLELYELVTINEC
ncbi:MAG: hypothetical protein OEM27_02405 [Nitrospinota bacterium]|nr:hypothetical protein [Nitrospinota bacterium]